MQSQTGKNIVRNTAANIAAATLIVAALGVTAAHSHAFLDHANPLVGGTVQTAPHELTLWFTQKLEPAFSTVEVRDTSGGRVDRGKAQVSGNVMRVGLKTLPAGTYKVHWHVLSVDTHSTEGNFSFRVGGP